MEMKMKIGVIITVIAIIALAFFIGPSINSAFTLKEKKLTLDASKGVYLIEIRTSIGVKILRYIFN